MVLSVISSLDINKNGAHYVANHEISAQVAELHAIVQGQVALSNQRFDQIDTAITETKALIKEVKTEVNARIDKHEEEETPKIDTVRRLVWIAVGAIIILSTVIMIGINAMQHVLFR